MPAKKNDQKTKELLRPKQSYLLDIGTKSLYVEFVDKSPLDAILWVIQNSDSFAEFVTTKTSGVLKLSLSFSKKRAISK